MSASKTLKRDLIVIGAILLLVCSLLALSALVSTSGVYLFIALGCISFGLVTHLIMIYLIWKGR